MFHPQNWRILQIRLRPPAMDIQQVFATRCSCRHGAFHSHGGIQNGWFISWKIPLKWMITDNWGYPYFRKPPHGTPLDVPTGHGKSYDTLPARLTAASFQATAVTFSSVISVLPPVAVDGYRVSNRSVLGIPPDCQFLHTENYGFKTSGQNSKLL